MPRHAALLGLTIAALAACTTSKALPIDLSEVDAASASSTVAEAPTTTTPQIVPSTAVAPTSTSPSVMTGPATTAAAIPSTSAVDIDAAIGIAIENYWNARRECGAAPSRCDVAAFIAEGGELRSKFATVISDMVASASYDDLRPGGSIAATEVLRIADDLVAVKACEVNTDRFMDSNGTPDLLEDDIIRDDRTVTRIGEYTFRLVGAEWLPSDYVRLETIQDAAVCAA